MIYTPMTKTALKLCFEAHKDQTDKSGLPYVFHPFHLAEQMPDEKTTVVALLHDVIEDTEYTLDDLKNMGFLDDILSAIALMTHDDGVPYMEYVALIKKIQSQKWSSLLICAIIVICQDLTKSPPMIVNGQKNIKRRSNFLNLPTNYQTSFLSTRSKKS